VGDRDLDVVRRRGAEIARECVRLLTMPADVLARELRAMRYSSPEGLMPR
jgi:hypothetical protein